MQSGNVKCERLEVIRSVERIIYVYDNLDVGHSAGIRILDLENQQRATQEGSGLAVSHELKCFGAS